MSKNIILGYGLLGSEIVKQTKWNFICRSKDKSFDFDNIDTYKDKLLKYDTVINCVAYTDTYSNDKSRHWNTNYKALSDLVDFCNIENKKIVHISTDYIYAGSNKNADLNEVPVHNKTWYSYTKLLADAYIQLKSKKHLLIRCGHKEKPFKYEEAFEDVIGNFDYVDIIAKIIIDLIKNDVEGVNNIGTEVKSVYELAVRTNPNVIKSKSDNPLMPKDVTMDINK